MSPPESEPEIRFYFDYISHNAYLAWVEIHEIGARCGQRVQPVPVLFAGLLNAHGQLGPAEIAPKGWWMSKNVLRKAARRGIPLSPPPSHPFNPLLALRVSSLPMPEERQRELIDGLFRAVWAGGGGVTDPEQVAAIAGAAGIDGRSAVAEAGAPEAKQRLRSETDAAIAAGVFGVPTMIAGGELFWGYDDLEFLEAFLRGEDPLDREALEAWRGIRASAVRRRPESS